jgi:WD40 repeat protein
MFAQQTELSIQTGHVAAIYKVVFSPDGSLLASSDDQNKICIWDMSGLTQMASFFSSDISPTDRITQLAFSLDNTRLVVATQSGNIRVWDVAQSKKIFGCVETGIINKLYFVDNNSCLIVASDVKLLNLSTNSLSTLSNLQLSDIYQNKQTKELIFCTNTGNIGKISMSNGIKLQLSDSGTNNIKLKIQKKYSGINLIKVSGSSIALSNKFNIWFHDVISGNKKFSVAMPYMDEKITDIEFLPFNNCYIASNTDGKIYVYDYNREKLIKILKDHIADVNSLAVHPTRNIFASASADRSIILWDALTFKPLKRFYARASSIQCIDISKSNQLLSLGNELGDTKIINLADKYNEIKNVRNHRLAVNEVMFASEDHFLFTSSNDNFISKVKTESMTIEEKKKVKKSFGFKYLINNIIIRLNMYVEPYIFIDDISLSDDQSFVNVKGYKFKSKSVKKSKKFLAQRTRVNYKDYFEYSYYTSNLKNYRKKKHLKQYSSIPTKFDSNFMDIDVYNKENGHISEITGAKLDKLHNRLITSSKDATIKIWDINSKELIITMIPVDKNKRIFITADNYYFAPKNALNAIGFKQGIHFYPTEQFDLKYNRPDIVLEKLNNPDSNLIVLYRKAYEKRLKKSGFNEQMFTSDWHTPEIKINDVANFNYNTGQAEHKLSLTATDSKYKLDRINIWINDVPLYGLNGWSLRKEHTDSVTLSLPVKLAPGNNKIQVSCFNDKGIESLRESVEMLYKPVKETKPDLYIIAMSVSEYKDNRYNLKYAVKDGADIAGLFNTNQTERYNKIYLDTLFNSNATRQNFFNIRNKLLKSDVNDEVVMFISGHGLLNKEMDFYFATYDIDFSDPEISGISFDDLESLLDSIPARKKLLMMDACHSGEVDKDETPEQIFAARIESTPDITFRGNLKEYNFRGVDSTTVKSGMNLNNTFELMQELFAGLDKGTGTVVISAAAGKGFALESDKWNNGVFTYSILNGLENKAADKNKDKIITISELKAYSIQQVELLTGGKQKPTARRETTGFDWRVW